MPLSAAAAGGLAAATGDRLAPAAALVAVDVVGDAAATVWLGVSERVAVGDGVAVGAGLDVADGGGVVPVAVALGAGEAPLNVAHAFVSCDATEKQTDLAVGSHAVPSVAVRESDRRMKG